MKTCKTFLISLLSLALLSTALFQVYGEETPLLTAGTSSEGGQEGDTTASSSSDTVILRICNWEEYIDEGDWDEDEAIELDSQTVFGENSMIQDFEDWYLETYGKNVIVEYSTFGTNEDLYNMLTLGDVFDLVCPSDYMIMKLMAQGDLVPLSDSFFDPDIEENYYIKGVSNFINTTFTGLSINGESLAQYSAGYMWGVTGFVYNPEEVAEEDVSTWRVLTNKDYARRITIKDSYREAYVPAMGAVKSALFLSEDFKNAADYHERLTAEMNDTSQEAIQEVQEYLHEAHNNLYSFEVDSGKSDMITGKVLINYQWSGDAVYIMDQAEEDDTYLNFIVPEESTNTYFDGWCMLKAGIGQDAEKQQAAEAFMNFVSRPDNAIRNMYYIGYTSVISGGEDSSILEYADWNFGAEEDEEATVEYDISYFFSPDGEHSEDYVLTVPEEQLKRQLGAQYPSEEIVARGVVMNYFTSEEDKAIDNMWITVRCFSLIDVPVFVWPILLLLVIGLVVRILIRKRQK